MHRSKNICHSFRHASEGFAHCLRTQRNVRVHLAATVIVTILGVWLNINTTEWALIFLAFGLVWMAELSNTALEAVVDLLSPERHNLARVAKDVKAAAVVSGVAAAIIVGLLILGPALLAKLGF